MNQLLEELQSDGYSVLSSGDGKRRLPTRAYLETAGGSIDMNIDSRNTETLFELSAGPKDLVITEVSLQLEDDKMDMTRFGNIALDAGDGITFAFIDDLGIKGTFFYRISTLAHLYRCCSSECTLVEMGRKRDGFIAILNPGFQMRLPANSSSKIQLSVLGKFTGLMTMSARCVGYTEEDEVAV